MTLKCWICERAFEDSEGMAPYSIFGEVCWDCRKVYAETMGPSEAEMRQKRDRMTFRARQDQGFARRKDHEQDDPDRYPWPVEEG